MKLDIYKAAKDKGIFKPFFGKNIKSWQSWFVFFKVLAGYPESKFKKKELELFRRFTGLSELPKKKPEEVFLICGRRSGKSSVSAILSIFYAIWGGWEKDLSAGEKVHIFIVSPNVKQGGIIKGYCMGILNSNPTLKRLVKKELSSEIHLTNGVIISIKPASWRTSRGYTVGLTILEELAYWRFEEQAAKRDKEIYTALTPGMSGISNSLCLGISTPFIREGLLWQKYKNHWGKPGSTLIWRAPSWEMNLSLTKEKLEDRFLETLGEAEFLAEYGAEFREDITGFLPASIIDDITVEGRTVLEPDGERYNCFADPSQGLRAGGDSMTIAIAHPDVNDDGQMIAVLDFVEEFKPPFKPDQVIERMVEICKQYEISEISQDRHALGWIQKDLERYEIRVNASELTKSDIYDRFSVYANKRKVEILDNPRLRSQILGLQIWHLSGGRVKIDHLSGRHDDVANAACGALVNALDFPYVRPEIWVA